MSFLTFSLFLGGLTAAAIPVLLHLTMRGVPKRIEFPALRLIQLKLSVTKRNYRIKQLLLLAMRILIVIVIGLLLSRPSLKIADWFPSLLNPAASGSGDSFVSSLAGSLTTQEAPIAAALVIDTSPRMEYLLNNVSRLDAAREYARWVIAQLPKNSRIAIIGGRRDEAVAFQADPLAATQRLARLSTENEGRRIAESIQEALRLLDDSAMEQHELYVFSDLTEPGWPTEQTKVLRAALDRTETNAERNIYIVDVGAEQPMNGGITSLRLSEQVTSVNASVRIEAKIAQIGQSENRTIELLLQGTNSDTEEAMLPGGFERHGSRTLRFSATDVGMTEQDVTLTLPPLPVGIHQGKLRLTGSDPFIADDEGFFTINVRPAWRLLLVAPEPTSRYDRYLRTALSPSLLKRQGFAPPFDTATITQAALEKMAMGDLNRFQAVLLLDPAPMEPATWKMLVDYAARGSGVATFLGRRAVPLDKFNQPFARELLGGLLTRQARATDEELWMVPNDYTLSPLFVPFRPLSVAETPWRELPIRRYWELRDLTDAAETVARFSDGRPAILTQRLGEGVTLTMTTPLSDPPNSPPNISPEEQHWNYLTDPSWVFLALVDGMARYLIGVGEQRYNFQVAQPAVIDPGLTNLPANCIVTRPGNESLAIAPPAGERLIRFPGTDRPGQYRIRSGGAKDRLDTGFSVNFSPEVSDFRRIGFDMLDAAFGEERYRVARTPAEIEIGIARRRVGQELYVPLFLLLCILFAGEYLFANFFYARVD